MESVNFLCFFHSQLDSGSDATKEFLDEFELVGYVRVNEAGEDNTFETVMLVAIGVLTIVCIALLISTCCLKQR